MNEPETLRVERGADSGAAPCSATVEKPHKVHVWVCGYYCGPYEFATAEEADADYEYRKAFHVLGCHYRRESPNAGAEPRRDGECSQPKWPQEYVGYGFMVCLDCLDTERKAQNSDSTSQTPSRLA